MKAKKEQSQAMDPNPVLGVAKNGVILYSNEAGKPLLHDWGVRVGDKLPLHLKIFVQRAVSRKSIEKIEVTMGKKVYFIVFHPLPERECVNIYGFDISDRKKLEGKSLDFYAGVKSIEMECLETKTTDGMRNKEPLPSFKFSF